MIRLEDSVVVAAAPERVWAWLSELPSQYRAWHPDHVACRYVRGDGLRVGSVLRVVERLHGSTHHLTLRATEVVPCRRLRYRGRGFRGAFELTPANGGTVFTARLEFGWRIPCLGAFVDAVANRLLAARFRSLQRHMREEGRNLKRLLESGAAARR